MIQIVEKSGKSCRVSFCTEEAHYYTPDNFQISMGQLPLNKIRIKEIMAGVIKELIKHEVYSLQMDISAIVEKSDIYSLRDIVEGLMLGTYEIPRYPAKAKQAFEIDVTGLTPEETDMGQSLLSEAVSVIQGVIFARDMVNMPGNKLHPSDFAGNIKTLLQGLPVECEVMDAVKLREIGMNGLLAVGESSAYEPCFLIMRYLPLGAQAEKTALVGKGVTCDTGGYCLKQADSMLGIKGDMAGGAAVAGAIYALAKNHVQKNVIGFIPMCENRISTDSLLPGDVYTAFNGTTVEVLNTDAEGRLILADAVSYAANVEKADKIVDIATLTSAVVNLFGFSIAGALCDNDAFYEKFEKAYAVSGEQYWRIPFYKEHEKMLVSKIADIKNTGEKHCGTITAALFIRKFAEKLPWIHLDIAGTAWVDTPVFEFQSAGATGAGVTTLYYLCSQKG